MDFMDIDIENSAKIKVFGVGGGGGNAVQNMIASNLKGVTFIVANTDVQALGRSTAEHKIQLGDKLTKGLGAGANPQIGRDAALESINAIKECIGEADMVFVTAGMGGGTGTGAAPVIAQAAKESGALTVGVVTKPFFFEGPRRRQAAEQGIQEFRQYVDSLITIPNDRLLSLAPKKAPLLDMLKKADEVLFSAVKGISDLITIPGIINLDFADVKAVMGESGLAMMGAGVARGETRAREAAMQAITSPLLEDISIDGARGVLLNITGSYDLTLEEVTEAAGLIQEAAHDDAQIFFGTVFDEEAGDEIRITVIATGIETVGTASAKADPVSSLTQLRRPKPQEPQRGGNILSTLRAPEELRSAEHQAQPQSPQQSPQSQQAQYHQYQQQAQPTQQAPQQASQAPQHYAQPSQAQGGVQQPYQQQTQQRPQQGQQAQQQAYAPRGLAAFGDEDRNIPAYLRKQNQTQSGMGRGTPHNPGGDDFVFDEDEFELPAFIRKQAD